MGKDLKHSRTLRTGLELGLLRVKVCTMVVRLCKSQERTPHTQLSLILDPPSFPSHQMFSRKSGKNGPKLCQTSIAPLIRLSAMLRKAARTSHPRSNQSVSR